MLLPAERRRSRHAPGLAAVCVAAVVAAAAPAVAAGIGPAADLVPGAAHSLNGPEPLFALLPFLVGSVIGISGLLKFREHAESPMAVPLVQPIIRVILGAMLLSLPAILGIPVGFDLSAMPVPDPAAGLVLR